MLFNPEFLQPRAQRLQLVGAEFLPPQMGGQFERQVLVAHARAHTAAARLTGRLPMTVSPG